jgi:hypothetical protein
MPDPAEIQTPIEAAPAGDPPPAAPPAEAAPPSSGALVGDSPPGAVRPDFIPESLWEDGKGLKGDAVANILKEHGELKAAAEALKADVPESADGYELALPEGFKTPEGMDLELDANDPFFAEARAAAHELGLPKAAFGKLVGLWASEQARNFEASRDTYAAEMGKLGDNARARLTDLDNRILALLPETQARLLINAKHSAADVEAFEGGARIAGHVMPGGGSPPAAPPASIAERMYGSYPPAPRKAT